LFADFAISLNPLLPTYLMLSFCNVPNSILHVIVSQKCCDDTSWVTIRRNRNGEPAKYLRPLLNDAKAFNNLDIICCSGCGPFVIINHFMRLCSDFDLRKSSKSYFWIMTTVSILFPDLVNLLKWQTNNRTILLICFVMYTTNQKLMRN